MYVYFKLAVLWIAQIAMGSRKSVQIWSANLTLKISLLRYHYKLSNS